MVSSAAPANDRPLTGGLFFYFSDLLDRQIVDSEGRAIGRLADLSVRLASPTR